MSRPKMVVSIDCDPHHGYGIFDAEALRVTSSSSTAAGPIYDQNRHRELAFGDWAMVYVSAAL
jgi:hypothetical protein